MKIKMKNGDVITVGKDQTPEQAMAEWRDEIMREKGADPNFKMKTDAETMYEAGKKYNAENPNMASVAAIDAGMSKLGRNVANMVLPQSLQKMGGFTDEDLAEKEAQDKPLREDQPVSFGAGSVAPTLALPVGEAMALPATIARGMGEGAAYGGTMAGPGDRGKGAGWGALSGIVPAVLQRTLSRLVGGMGVKSKDMLGTEEIARRTPGGEVPFIPINKGAATSGPGSTARYIYDKILPQFPGASRKFEGQTQELIQTTYENMLRQAFGANADVAINVLKTTGKFNKAVKAGQRAQAANPQRFHNKTYVEALEDAGNRSPKGNPDMATLSRSAGNKGQDYLKEMAGNVYGMLDSMPKGEGNLVMRHLVNWTLKSGNLLTATIIPRALASKGVQNFIMGNQGWQKLMSKAINDGDDAATKLLMERALREGGIEVTQEKASELRDYGAEQVEKAKKAEERVGRIAGKINAMGDE
jgi:hypothetical protein